MIEESDNKKEKKKEKLESEEGFGTTIDLSMIGLFPLVKEEANSTLL